nr:retrotransposon protein, putative, Ty3-gypsy subclass [Tanacetum cinerariifolium]
MIAGIKIKEAQKEDSKIWTIVENLDKQVEFHLDDDNVLWQDTRLVVPNDASLREALLTEAHSSPFSIHPRSTKMYHDLKQHFWWSDMKGDVAMLAKIFQQEIVRLHGTLSAIISDKDPRFASHFWKGLQKAWGTRLKKCRALICWDQVGERVIEGPEMIEVTNAKVAIAKEKLKEARTRQKSYADKHRKSLEFQPG